MPRRRLPPLNALSAFEAVAEHGSLSAAARSRGVAQPAVSRHITVLEEWMSVALVERRPNSVTLTADGVELSRNVREAFDQIELAVRRVQERHAAPVVLGCSSAIAYLWLMPQLSSLHLDCPGADLSLFCSENYSDFERPDIDLSIRFGNNGQFPASARMVIPECAFPVAAPEFAEEKGLTDTSTPDEYNPEDLLHHTRGTYGWLNWPAYFEACGFQFEAFETISSYNNYSLLIDRARKGEGIVMGHAGPINQSLEDGSLVRVGAAVQRPSWGFFLIPNAARVDKPSTHEIQGWLLQRPSLNPVENPVSD